MKKLVNSILIFLMASLVILATGGFSIYHHICHCAEDNTATIFMEAKCQHESASSPSSCCSVTENQSCCSSSPDENESPACHDGDCCQNSSQFLKINDSFQPGISTISLKPVHIVTALLATEISVKENSNHSEIFVTTDLPPPDSGKQIILSLHQLKLDPSLV